MHVHVYNSLRKGEKTPNFCMQISQIQRRDVLNQFGDSFRPFLDGNWTTGIKDFGYIKVDT